MKVIILSVFLFVSTAQGFIMNLVVMGQMIADGLQAVKGMSKMIVEARSDRRKYEKSLGQQESNKEVVQDNSPREIQREKTGNISSQQGSNGTLSSSASNN